jgi:hypothetical protein
VKPAFANKSYERRSRKRAAQRFEEDRDRKGVSRVLRRL